MHYAVQARSLVKVNVCVAATQFLLYTLYVQAWYDSGLCLHGVTNYKSTGLLLAKFCLKTCQSQALLSPAIGYIHTYMASGTVSSNRPAVRQDLHGCNLLRRELLPQNNVVLHCLVQHDTMELCQVLLFSSLLQIRCSLQRVVLNCAVHQNYLERTWSN